MAFHRYGKIRSITIATIRGDMIIDAYFVNAFFAVHRPTREDHDPKAWYITHIPTKKKIARRLLKKEAFDLAHAFYALDLPWHSTNEIDITGHKLARKVFELRNEIT